ncbi:MAG: GNAT family N-acetyltransferase, partial [Hyphomicrobiaceae bacterium]
MANASPPFTVVRPDAGHRAAWDRLFAGYAAFYKVAQTPEMRDRVWSWIADPRHEVKAFIALDGSGTPIGLAHYRPFARPLHAVVNGFLDDLFVDPAHRGGGVADGLIAAVAEEGRRQGWTGLRWLTAENNYRA